jgi:hypothetical protein
MNDEPEQDAIFEMEGPDEDSCVWLLYSTDADAVVVNLGPTDAIAPKLTQWLAEIDFSE